MVKRSASLGNKVILKRQPNKRKLSLSQEDDGARAEWAARPHSAGLHTLNRCDVARLQPNLLEWFARVRDVRGMPWRRHVTNVSPDEQAQRAYEVSI